MVMQWHDTNMTPEINVTSVELVRMYDTDCKSNLIKRESSCRGGVNMEEAAASSSIWPPGGAVCRFFTFAGLAVRLQGEADGAAAAHPRHRVVTRAVTAAIVHCTGLCRGGGGDGGGQALTVRQTPGKQNNAVDAVLTYLFLFSPHRKHAWWCDSENVKTHLYIYIQAFLFSFFFGISQETKTYI